MLVTVTIDVMLVGRKAFLMARSAFLTFAYVRRLTSRYVTFTYGQGLRPYPYGLCASDRLEWRHLGLVRSSAVVAFFLYDVYVRGRIV